MITRCSERAKIARLARISRAAAREEDATSPLSAANKSIPIHSGQLFFESILIERPKRNQR